MNVMGFDRLLCCGCGLCAAVCPVSAITMVRDAEGFAYPASSGRACVQCGACVRRCPAQKANGGRLKDCVDALPAFSAWAAQCRDADVRNGSSSGGMFSLLAGYVLAHGGYVYGAAFDEHWRVKHIEVNTLDGLQRLRSSKYAQSDLTGVFARVKGRLVSGAAVLFSGVPCQIEALKTYLENAPCERLTCVDLFCHGVSSPGLFEKYLRETVGDPGRIRAVSFRDKTPDWERYRMKITLETKTYQMPYARDPYLKAFCRSLSLRPSCYRCLFKGFPRQSDLTLGDFWAVDSVLQGFSDRRGTSLILVNTEKGGRLFNAVREGAAVAQVDRAALLRVYGQAGDPVKEPDRREAYFQTVMNGRVASGKKYCYLPLKAFIKKHLKRLFIRLNRNRAKARYGETITGEGR